MHQENLFLISCFILCPILSASLSVSSLFANNFSIEFHFLDFDMLIAMILELFINK